MLRWRTMPERLSISGEVGLALLVVGIGVGVRLAVVHVFPSAPVSDFHELIRFGQALRARPFVAGGYWWQFFSPGLPLTLSALLALFGDGDAAAVARLATAVVTGTLGLFPLLLWRCVASLTVRLGCALALALWPGQVLFSGVVAQDNWVLPATVALGCLAVRATRRRAGWPVASALLWALVYLFRQEMLVAAAPLALTAGGWLAPRRWRSLAICTATTTLLVGVCAAERAVATGRFALTSGHSGLAVLGSYVPRSSLNGWIDPLAHIAATRPQLLESQAELEAGAGDLVWDEIATRPLFQAARIGSLTAHLLLHGERANLAWSLLGDGVLAGPARRLADRWASTLARLLDIECAVLVALLVLAAGTAWRDTGVRALLAAIVLKVGLHAVTVLQGRFLIAASALAILAVAAAEPAIRAASPARRWSMAGAGVLTAVLLAGLGDYALPWVQERDVEPPRTYRFPLGIGGGKPLFDCTVAQGVLAHLERAKRVTLLLRASDPSPGDRSIASCVPRRRAKREVILRLFDPYAAGGFPDRIAQRVLIGSRLQIDHDLAADAGSGWIEVPLASRGEALPVFEVQVVAIRPDRGPQWGAAAPTIFELAAR